MSQKDFDVVIIGAGISGISAAHFLKEKCPGKTFTILEGRTNIGGTWDLFKYPGIRSDSDMYTLGFEFKPWKSPKAIADGPAIMDYLNETIQDEALHQYIKINHKVNGASWSSTDSTWTLDVLVNDSESKSLTCQFVYMCTGYYNYEKGFTPEFNNVDSFTGKFIHPQHWPEDLDYTNKKVVVIGSGATAVTLIPELAKKAAHVTMLQRSPTYITVGPSEDKIANFFNNLLPDKWAYTFNRSRKIRVGNFFYKLARKNPKLMSNLIKKGVKKELGDYADIDKHFTPKYNPWDQRICLAPDGDFFNALKSGGASIVTDTIQSFTENGIQLESGANLEADIVISATGLELKFFGGVDLVVDNDPVDFASLVVYKGTMFSDVPNLCLAFGYTNASWTLKCDLSNDYFARIIQHMAVKGYQTCVPTFREENISTEPFVDFNSSYILRYINDLPKQGTKEPWKLKQDYFVDRKKLRHDAIEDGVLEFRAAYACGGA